MALNKPLYRILRSGGLNGRAAEALANPASPYSVTPTALTDVGALTSVVAAGATPTKAEYDALRADVATLRTKVNALLAEHR